MIVEATCEHFIFQNDDNGEMAISICSAMKEEWKDHEGNNVCYACPLGYFPKRCYEVIALGSDIVRTKLPDENS